MNFTNHFASIFQRRFHSGPGLQGHSIRRCCHLFTVALIKKCPHPDIVDPYHKIRAPISIEIGTSQALGVARDDQAALAG